MDHFIDTKRLRIFEERMIIAPQYTSRRVFVAFRLDEDRPLMLGNAIVMDANHSMGCWYLDWIEVSSEYRLEGFGRELFTAIADSIGGVWCSTGATVEGLAFCASLDLDGAGYRCGERKESA